MKSKELQKRLKIDAAQLRALVARGLPVGKKGRARDFNPAEVDQWLLDNGFAAPQRPADPPEVVCTTYAELARALNMNCRDPIRTIAGWVNLPGFPGTAGQPGKRNARLPVQEIRDWLATRQSGAEYASQADELRELDRERRRLQIEFENRKLRQQLDRLADVEEVARFNRQAAADAQAILRPLPDEVVDLLPSNATGRTRARVHARTNELIENAFAAIARMIRGDADNEETKPQEDDDKPQEGGKAIAPAAARRSRRNRRRKR